MVNTLYVGWDSREYDAFRVCAASILATTKEPIQIIRLIQPELRRMGLYRRAQDDYAEGRVDYFDGKPYSTEFSFSRFLVPMLQQWQGWALFMDSDMFFREDINELFKLADNQYAVMVVKHDHRPPETEKMRDSVQTRYYRKNWSSVVLWNCTHEANKLLTVDDVNLKTGSYLHGFQWLRDEEIGELPVEWNWLEGWSSKDIKPKNVHYTRGTPNLPKYADAPYADEWKKCLDGLSAG